MAEEIPLRSYRMLSGCPPCECRMFKCLLSEAQISRCSGINDSAKRATGSYAAQGQFLNATKSPHTHENSVCGIDPTLDAQKHKD